VSVGGGGCEADLEYRSVVAGPPKKVVLLKMPLLKNRVDMGKYPSLGAPVKACNTFSFSAWLILKTMPQVASGHCFPP
jgi:hypothetical protein